ncbi:MAG TPA: molybdate ABC transporter substrate-binding protein [Gammaproteobacteria bacterium]|nr:molybdate ABC transporter substrate-binding protein [Gammaproteobacteria bacterium]
MEFRNLMNARWLGALMLLWCFGSSSADEIRVAVASNFSATMNQLVKSFEERGDHKVLVSFGSTGNHYAQIKNGAPFDAFFAADVERPELLEKERVAIAGSRFTYAVGRIALWSRQPDYVDAEGQVLETGDFRFLAIANPDLAPYGAAAREVLVARGLLEQLHGRLVQGQDIGQTYSFVYTENAQLGFVAYSQLEKPGRQIEGSFWLVPQTLHRPIEQQAVLLRDIAAAREFLKFVKGEEARMIIRSYGYGP